MIHREFRWDNDEYHIARAAHKCCMPDYGGGGWGGDGAPGGADDGVGDRGAYGGAGMGTSHGGTEAGFNGLGEFNGEPNSGLGGQGSDAGGEGMAAKRNCELKGGTWKGDLDSGYCDMSGAGSSSGSGSGSGSGSHEGGEEEPENEADIKFAKLLREQWKDYKDRWLPVEEEMSSLLTSDDFGEDVVNRARQAGLAMDSADQTARQLDRYGVELGTRQQQALMNSATQNRYAQAVGAANKTRVGMVDLKDALQKDMIGIGHGVGASATAGLGAAAQMEIQRGQAIAGMKNQHAYMQASLGMQQQLNQNQFKYAQKSQKSGIFGLIGTAVGGYFGGPVGAMIGGGIGSMIG